VSPLRSPMYAEPTVTDVYRLPALLEQVLEGWCFVPLDSRFLLDRIPRGDVARRGFAQVRPWSPGLSLVPSLGKRNLGRQRHRQNFQHPVLSPHGGEAPHPVRHRVLPRQVPLQAGLLRRGRGRCFLLS